MTDIHKIETVGFRIDHVKSVVEVPASFWLAKGKSSRFDGAICVMFTSEHSAQQYLSEHRETHEIIKIQLKETIA